ncbi:manganese catalase family protein [Parvularcula oceani]|uniref:manganese catalase family protein n=1 Tax=Parvularcula oceani TaxID=1247963 RepID=UPI0004E0EF7A|nr:manganese catalase family protein [Parvularcula oceani]
MYFHDKRLQYPVKVDNPDPVYARALQQAIGGIEGEIRVCLQYFFQAWGARGPSKYRDLLLETATEELGHIEMLATAVAMNLEGAPISEKEEVAKDPIDGAVLNGMNFRHILSTGLAALPVNADGVPFDTSHVYASGNLAADMFANVTAESTGRTLAVRLYNMTDDPGMKDMWKFLIARDTMHQQQWLAAIEDMGGIEKMMPIPNSFDQAEENQDVNYTFMGTSRDGSEPVQGRWSSGKSMDGRAEFKSEAMEPKGEEPKLSPPKPGGGAQKEQMSMVQQGVEIAKNALS